MILVLSLVLLAAFFLLAAGISGKSKPVIGIGAVLGIIALLIFIFIFFASHSM